MPMITVNGRLLLVHFLICKPYNDLFLHTRTERRVTSKKVQAVQSCGSCRVEGPVGSKAQ